MRYIVTINNKNYEVEVEQGQASIVKIDNAAAQAAVQAQSVTAAPAPAAPQPQAPAAPAPAAPAPAVSAVPGNGEPVKAPMPGTILDLKVSSGQTVKKGDVLFILEAMKMENEIMSPADGVVQVAVSKGTSVSTGDVLAIIQ